MISVSAVKSVAASVLLAALAACAGGEPLEPTAQADEIPPGPGIFSGEDGEFVIYSR